MKRWLLAIALVLSAVPGLRASDVQAQAACQFMLGFATLRDLLSPQLVGECLEDEQHNPANGDGLQHTAGGLLVWRKADNWTAFTNGAATWVNGPAGLDYRLNTERFPWEADAALFPQPSVMGSRCGVERWDVKTLSDPAAGTVNFTPQGTTVDELRALPDPVTRPSTPRLQGSETTTATVQATLVTMKLETDHDIHLVIADPSDGRHTLIAEFPDPGCSGAVASAKKAEMAAARAALVAACGAPPSTFISLSGSARITGVVFFDVRHRTPQVGVAPNNVELHPVLRVDNVTCHAG